MQLAVEVIPSDYRSYYESHVQSLSENLNGEMKSRKELIVLQACRVRKYAKFGVFYANVVQMTPLRLRRESVDSRNFR